MYDYLDARQEKIAVVISADLAHTHKASGPYGYSNASEPFDMVTKFVYLVYVYANMAKLQWLEHLMDHEKMFETEVVRAYYDE